MADLLDIAPSTALQSVHLTDGRPTTVRGLRGNDIAAIIARFPQLANLLGGNRDNFGPRLIAEFGNAIGPIIAAGCNHLNEEKYEQHAASMYVEDQLKLVQAIIGLTFPNGVTSFVTTMTAFLVGTNEREKPVKMRLKKSPSPSPPSSAADSPATMQ